VGAYGLKRLLVIYRNVEVTFSNTVVCNYVDRIMFDAISPLLVVSNDLITKLVTKFSTVVPDTVQHSLLYCS